MEASGQEGGRGLRRDAIGLPGLVAQSLGVTAPEISAVVIVAGAALVTECYGQQGIYRWAPYVMLAWIVLGAFVRLATRRRVAEVERRTEAAQPELTPAL